MPYLSHSSQLPRWGRYPSMGTFWKRLRLNLLIAYPLAVFAWRGRLGSQDSKGRQRIQICCKVWVARTGPSEQPITSGKNVFVSGVGLWPSSWDAAGIPYPIWQHLTWGPDSALDPAFCYCVSSEAPLVESLTSYILRVSLPQVYKRVVYWIPSRPNHH